jgi:DNA-binding MarR family transcriptional regulator
MEATTTAETASSAERFGTCTDTQRLPFGLLLARLGQESVARFRKSLKPLGLNTQQYFVLRQLQAIGAASQASLADALGLDYSNLATITSELHERGLIERNRYEGDRRRYVVHLTEAGERLTSRASEMIADGEEDLIRTLDDGSRERFWELLREVADAAELTPRDDEDETRACREVHVEADGR